MMLTAGLSGVCVAGDANVTASADGLRLTLRPFSYAYKGIPPPEWKREFEFGFYLYIENAGETTQVVPTASLHFEIKPPEDGTPVQVVLEIWPLRPKTPGEFRHVDPVDVYRLASVEQWEALGISHLNGNPNHSVDNYLRQRVERGKYVGPPVGQHVSPSRAGLDKPENYQPWPDSSVEFIFRVGEEFAKRYGTWHGELKCVDPRLTVKDGRLQYDWPPETE